MRYKHCKFRENCAGCTRYTPVRGVYIPTFGQISLKYSVLGVLYIYRCTDGGEIWHEWVDLRLTPPCQVSPSILIGAACRPCAAKNLKIALWITYIPALCAAGNAAGNKNSTFVGAPRRVKSEPHQTWHRGPCARSSTSKTSRAPTHSFAARGRWKCGEAGPLKLKPI